MSDVVRNHLAAVVIISLAGVATGAFSLLQALDAVSTMDVSTFSTIVFLVPCAIMLVCSFAIVATAQQIGRQLYVVILAICLAFGIASLIASSFWLSDATIASQLLANSPDGTSVTVPSNSPLIVLRDIAAYVVVPTVGCILGAWVGSRIHPMTSAPTSAKQRAPKQKH